MDLKSNKSYLNWSGGKDCSLALYQSMQEGFPIDKLVTTCNTLTQRVSMHGVKISLLRKQAERIGMPLHLIMLEGHVTIDEYNRVMEDEVKKLKAQAYTHAVFGDIFLEDLRTYREHQLASVGMGAMFPLWKRNTDQLAKEFIKYGFKAVVVCVNANCLNESFVGRMFDEKFLSDLPANVDPCGEHGEFHTFVFDGPVFRSPVQFEIGENVFRKYESKKNDRDECFSSQPKTYDTGFWYADLI